jgi:SAM-dependent methyltransferase
MSERQTARQWLLALAGLILKIVPANPLRVLLAGTTIAKARSLPPEEGLRFLFWIDSALYPTMGQLATKYGDGTHVKHRLIKYNDFFVARITASDSVLDIGCGIGAVAFDIANRTGASVVGIDISEQNLAVARDRYSHSKVRYIHGDALKFLPEEHFDIVVLSNVLEHLPGRTIFLKRVQSATKAPRFLIRVPLFERDWRVPLKQELGVEYRLDDTHEIEYTLESFAEEMADAGLVPYYQEVRWGEIWTEVRPNGS